MSIRRCAMQGKKKEGAVCVRECFLLWLDLASVVTPGGRYGVASLGIGGKGPAGC